MKFCPECGKNISKNNIDGAVRYICSDPNCNYIYWDNPVPVVAALVKHNGQYLIARNTKWPKGIFSLITGYLEAGEETEQAVIREVEEELGLNSMVTHFLGNYSFVEKNQVIMAYEVEATGTLRTNHELAESKYLSRDELAAYNFHPLYITEKIIQAWSNLNSKKC